MSRRSSNSVKLTRARLARFGTRTDRNGFPILDGKERNRLPRGCADCGRAPCVCGPRFAAMAEGNLRHLSLFEYDA